MLYQERDNRFRHTEVYIMQIKGIIASSRKNYSSYEQSAVSDGMPFICVNIEDENGKPLKSITQSPTPFSTEEEINLLMTNKDQQKKVQLRFDSMKNDLLDTYLAFVEDTAGSRIRFKQTEIKKNDPANPAFFSSLTE